eukprot:TRINITY_DN2428_c0_g1_i1.p1 TRINITY_DN2428_c0_g1~~TRINITY_DN2428_c0_g1_i1.p1  ORF type:complete len:195 (-),score=30.46 TRINITY_DN2428_c0_g1_i1:86-670(-)
MSTFEEYRITVIGPGGAGKSAITIMFLQGTFLSKYDPTIEDSYRHIIEVDGTSCTLDIMDTAGQEEFAALRDTYMKTGEGFLLVYSITSASSFRMIELFFNRVRTIQEDKPPVPIILMANKKDLSSEREVSTTEGQQLATKLNIPFMEVSAKNNQGITEAFTRLVSDINDWREKFRPKTSKEDKKLKKRKCVLF